MSGWYFANLLIGGAIGAVLIDPATGCMWTYYDKEVRLKMYPDTAGGYASKLTDEKANAEAEAKAEQARLAKAENPIQNALASTSQKIPKNIPIDNSVETAISEPSQETPQNISITKEELSTPNLDYIDTLVKGKTTRQDVERVFGAPIQEELSMDGQYVFCAYLCKKTSPENPLDETYKLILKFDRKGVLDDYRTKVAQ